MRKEISTHTPSEERVGYSRAVRVDNRIYFSGTTAQDEQGRAIGETVYQQTQHILGRISNVLKREDFQTEDIVDLTAYLVDMKQLPEFDRAFSEHFKNSRPCCTLVGVSYLVDPKLLIEIKCIAEKST